MLTKLKEGLDYIKSNPSKVLETIAISATLSYIAYRVATEEELPKDLLAAFATGSILGAGATTALNIATNSKSNIITNGLCGGVSVVLGLELYKFQNDFKVTVSPSELVP